MKAGPEPPTHTVSLVPPRKRDLLWKFATLPLKQFDLQGIRSLFMMFLFGHVQL